tara:strand:+ start:166 stop:579 length:414 start_codon:yes stop_codon:yes gene_type:complete
MEDILLGGKRHFLYVQLVNPEREPIRDVKVVTQVCTLKHLHKQINQLVKNALLGDIPPQKGPLGACHVHWVLSNQPLEQTRAIRVVLGFTKTLRVKLRANLAQQVIIQRTHLLRHVHRVMLDRYKLNQNQQRVQGVV